ncbi:FAD-binding protein [Agromyces sp. H66]|uniref:FAD-binding protein n=1 Tax=Agromyces sp. H66 TaxID=2529859 RepID=UPI001B7D90B6|nr:FAD-binding protein [Agromyces sp. H66]
MTITIDTAPIDEHGYLVHAEDATAQLCLALVRLETELHARGLPRSAVGELRVLAVDGAHAAELVDVVAERFDDTTAPAISCVEVERLALDGMLVAVSADVTARTRTTHWKKDSDMNPSLIETPTLRDAGTVFLPDDPGYDDARTPWNLAVTQRPAAVAVPRSIEEVARVVTAAAGLGLRIAPQSTGHGAAALGARSLDDVLLLRLHELTGVTVDPERRIARVLGGTLWRDVVAAAAPHGLTALHGSAGDVAVAGYVLGGGLSFYGRRHGLAASHLRAVELVTADGTLVRATADEHPDLFWALRGGGGNFGAVVALEIELLPYPDVFAGMLLWDLARADEVTRAWRTWTADLPDSVTTSLRFMRFPPIPELPPFLSGRNLVVIDGAVLEDDPRAAELLAPLRALDPEMDTFARIPAEGMLAVHMDPPGPTPAVGHHALMAELPDAAIDALLAVVGPGVQIPLMFAELRHLGGALAVPHDGALDRLDGAYALFTVAPAPTPEMAEAGTAAADAVVAALGPWASPRTFLNFADRTIDVATAFDAESWARLGQVRRSIDPSGVWTAAHPVGTA